jgi:hypothetical protein
MVDRNRYEVSVLAKMWRRNLFGGKYEPLEKLMSDIPTERRDKAREAFETLHGDGLIIFHKGKKCASINTNHKEEVREILEGEVPNYILDLR